MRAAAISLDIWGTLLRSDPAFKPARNEMLRAELAPSIEPDAFNLAMRECDREADEICMARGTDVGFTERVHLTLAHLREPAVHPRQLPGSTVADERVSAETRDSVRECADIRESVIGELMERQATLARAHHPRALHDDLPGLVAELAATRPVILTSNTGMLPGVLMRELLVLAGFGGDLGMVFSNEVTWAKPDRRIFEVTLGLADGIPAQQVVHIGDNPVADVQGAEAAGLSAVLVQPDGLSTLAALEALR